MPVRRRHGIRSPVAALLAVIAVIAVLAAGFVCQHSGPANGFSGAGQDHGTVSSGTADTVSHDGHALAGGPMTVARSISSADPDDSATRDACPLGGEQQVSCSSTMLPAVAAEGIQVQPVFCVTPGRAGPFTAATDSPAAYAPPVSLVQLGIDRI